MNASFDSFPKSLDFKELELRIGTRWMNEKTFLYQENSTAPSFAIDTPPPTVSGSLHVGHIFSYTQTDIVARYHRMKGENVFYPLGWDDNGLPTERLVQNYFHIRCEASIPYEAGLQLPPILETMPEKELAEKKIPQRNLSRKNFIEHCHRLTVEDEKRFKELFSRVGLSVDWSLEYSTIDDRSRRLAQLSFLDLFEKKLLNQVEAPTLWDTDFQTAVAQAELEDRELPGAFHEIEFRVDGVSADAGGSFVIATTRPELLAACVGVATHPADERYRHLIGKQAVCPIFGLKVPIFGSDVVQKDKGTGILMVCTFGDQTDVQWWREQKLALRPVIGRDGRMAPIGFEKSVDQAAAETAYALIQGKTVKQAQKIMVEELQKQGFLKSAPKPITHAVKFYEKGDRPVEILTTRQWFVKLVDKKDQLIDMGEKIKWHPEFMKSRFKNWTENLSIDWCISRQRFFGVSIPVWYPILQSGVIDYEHPIVPTREMLPIDPVFHCPPGFTESQRGKPGGFLGEVDVFDTWFTSSITPQLGTHWDMNPARHEKLFPMSIRPQSHEIIRTWAFYTIAKAMLHENKIPWKDILISGWILDPDRKKMSKSKGNVVTPMQFIEEHGADAVRYWSGLARYGVDTAFDPGVMKIGRRLVTKIFNASKFVLSNSLNIKPDLSRVTNPLDLAFLQKLQAVAMQAKQQFEAYEPAGALQEAERFFWSHFTDTYIELAKGRAQAGEESATQALHFGLNVLLRLFAPFLPYITEEVWSWAYQAKSKSIHLARYPDVSDFSQCGAGKPLLFDTAVSALTAINGQKTLDKVSIARPVVQVTLKARAATFALLEEVARDVWAATKTQKMIPEMNETLEEGVIQVVTIEYGPEPVKT